MAATGESDGAHAGGLRARDTARRILNDNAVAGGVADSPRGMQVDVRRRLAARHQRGAEDMRREVPGEARRFELQLQLGRYAG